MNILIPTKGDEFTLSEDWNFNLHASHTGLGLINACKVIEASNTEFVATTKVDKQAPNVKIPKLSILKVTKVRSYHTGKYIQLQLKIIFCINKKIQNKPFCISCESLDNVALDSFNRLNK